MSASLVEVVEEAAALAQLHAAGHGVEGQVADPVAEDDLLGGVEHGVEARGLARRGAAGRRASGPAARGRSRHATPPGRTDRPDGRSDRRARSVTLPAALAPSSSVTVGRAPPGRRSPRPRRTNGGGYAPGSMRRASRLVLAFTALALLAAPRADADEPPLPIRVVTFNAWGVPVGSDHKEARLTRIGAALAALQPDVVALQELWSKDDLDLVQRDLAAGGLRHAERFPSRFGSGLLVASRWQLSTAQFQRFALGGKPHAVWHAHWWGGRGRPGSGSARGRGRSSSSTRTSTPATGPGGPPHAARQALELAAVAGEPVANEWAAALRSDAKSFEARLPLILAGDLNSGAGDLPFELLRARAGLQPAAPTGPTRRSTGCCSARTPCSGCA